MSTTLLALAIHRRAIAIAFFSELKLEYMEVRQLSHDATQAAPPAA